jgi:hypothetical protein
VAAADLTGPGGFLVLDRAMGFNFAGQKVLLIINFYFWD